MPARIGLIGCGRWGRLILRDLVTCGAEVCVVSPSPATHREALALGAASAQTAYAGLEKMDGLVVATPTGTHAAVLEELIQLGHPIFVEKPMTADVESARRLASIGEGRLFVMDKWRYHPVIQAMRDEIQAGRIGETLGIRTTRLGWGNPHRDVSALWILAPHDLAIALHLLGEIPPVRGAWPLAARKPELGFTAHLRGSRGAFVTLEVSAASPEYLRRCAVIGSRGTLELRGSYDDRLFFRDGAPGAAGAVERVATTSGKMPLLAELERFLAFLSGGPPPISSAAEGLLIVERLAAIEQAIHRESAQ